MRRRLVDGRRGVAVLPATLGLAVLALPAVGAGPAATPGSIQAGSIRAGSIQAASAVVPRAADLTGWKATWGTGFSSIPPDCSRLESVLGSQAWWDPNAVRTSGGSLTLDITPPNSGHPSEFGALGCPRQARVYGRWAITVRVTTLPADAVAYFALYPSDAHTDQTRAGTPVLGVEPPAYSSPSPAVLWLPAGGQAQTMVVESTPKALRLIAGGRTTSFPPVSGRRFPVIAAGPVRLTRPDAGSTGVRSYGNVVIDSLQTWAYSPSTVATPTPTPRPTRRPTSTTPGRRTTTGVRTTGTAPSPTATVPAPTTTAIPTTTPATTSTSTAPTTPPASPTPTGSQTNAAGVARDGYSVSSPVRGLLALGLLLAAVGGTFVGRRLVLARAGRPTPPS